MPIDLHGPRLTADKLNREGCLRLIEAICVEAAREYLCARWVYRHKPGDPEAEAHYKTCRSFFLSDYFAAITNLDGKAVLDRLDNLKRRKNPSIFTLFNQQR
jgi:hypothetical protein